MKRNNSYFLFFIFILFLISCGKVQSFEFKKIESWKMEKLGFNSSILSARLLFYNPNTFTITLKHLEGNLTIEGRDVGLCFSDTLMRISPQKEFLLPIAVQLKTGSLLLNGFNFLTKDSILLKFNGFARVGRSGIFIKYKFNGENKVPVTF